MLNVTVDAATATSFLTVSPADVARPIASNLNYTAGATVANQVIVRVPADGMIDIYNALRHATVIVDLVGYYETAGSDYAGRLHRIDPYRHIDTRVDDLFPPPGDLWDGDYVWIWWDDDPYSAPQCNVTVTDTTIGGYITTYPYPGDPPNTSTVNYGTATPSPTTPSSAAAPTSASSTPEAPPTSSSTSSASSPDRPPRPPLEPGAQWCEVVRVERPEQASRSWRSAETCRR